MPDTTPGTSDIEALARAIYDIEGWHAADTWDDETSIMRGRYLGLAEALLASDWLAARIRAEKAEAWFAGYDKGNLDGYFGTTDERSKSPYADLDPYRSQPASCSCGSPDTTSLNPREVVVHRTDGPCYIADQIRSRS